MIDADRGPGTANREPQERSAVSGPRSTVVAILAAGASTRMGTPKQLIDWHGTTLIRRAAQTAVDAGLGPVVVILGAHAERCLEAVAGMPIDEVIHPGWADGMGSSVAVAAAYARTHHPDAGGLLVMSCDQPGITPAHLIALREARRSGGTTMAASSYGGVLGIPALFDRELIPELMMLGGDRGAAALLRGHPGDVAAVPCEAAALDLDTPEDVSRMA